MLRLVAGLLLVATGGFLALHPLWAHGRSVTASPWLDMGLALVLLLRGAFTLRALWSRSAARRIVQRPPREE